MYHMDPKDQFRSSGLATSDPKAEISTFKVPQYCNRGIVGQRNMVKMIKKHNWEAIASVLSTVNEIQKR